MNLFATNEENENIPLGFRLERLEVYNWGTFDSRIWSLELNGEMSLLTGDVGSGKSTLVDALLTLLVPPRKVTYNKAADASAKERSLTSYVRGYYGQKRTDNGGGRPEALRDKNKYSVILGVFADKNFGRTVTLAQVFWFPEETASYPKRFYVLAQKTLSIKDRFSQIGGDMRAFRKALEKDAFIKTFDDYPQYGHEFRKIFGIRQVQAMDLFQQTVSMKKVDSLTSFVRQNMLEVPETEQEVELMLRQYHDLEAAHQAVQKAKKQQKMLQPIEVLGESYARDNRQQDEFQAMQKVLESWYAQQDYKAREEQLAAMEPQLRRLEEKITQQGKSLQEKQGELTVLQGNIARNGGAQLDEVRHQLDKITERKAQCEASREKFQQELSALEMTLPVDEEDFALLQEKLASRKAECEAQQEELTAEASTMKANRQEAEQEERRIQAEIDSLARRKSNIPQKFIAVREEICKALNLAESEMPFAGELIAVKEEEAEWEGAIERLLRSFGISLLVPEVHYGEVADWMERHDLKMRMVYFRVPAYPEQVNANVHEDAVCQKLHIKEDSPLAPWLEVELLTRFNHICCETIKEFRQAKFALTKAGQVKTGGKRHEKDDRHDIHDQRYYVLGFSNLKKIQALQMEMEDRREEQKFFLQKENQAKRAVKKLREQSEAIVRAGVVTSFAEIHIEPLLERMAQLKAQVEKLRAENDVLKQLQAEEQRLKGEIGAGYAALDDYKNQRSQLAERIRLHKAEMVIDEELFAGAESDDREKGYPLLQHYAALALEKLGSPQFDMQKRSLQQKEYNQWLNTRTHQLGEKLQKTSEELVKAMTEFRQEYPESASELLAAPEGYQDYTALLHRLQEDDLPKFESRFSHLLRENTINQIALFQTHLEEACHEIHDRIALINDSLAEIDYNEGRYIQIECNPAVSDTIQQFRRDLRACTDDALTGNMDNSYSEEKFQQVARILERLQGRPGMTDVDARWRSEVIDVRNWFVFAASELWRNPAPDMDKEYEHYTDSGGKSGGQKEKLAYTILAASIVYNFGLRGRRAGEQSFRFVVIDEAFLKSSDESARFGLELFKKLDLQLLVVTPLLKIATIEPFVSHVGFVYQRDEEHKSYLRNLTIEELQAERSAYQQQQ
ncbi:ATP-binding protein [Selenomonas sp. FC4001]|uniref:ATP-binding protein n=1 Tax=Selenomonas sp. FC4001 TaxID=1408313 RepID=UPI00055E0A4E|nr:ATP-binding protein [Selenomonas sp. FC4001]